MIGMRVSSSMTSLRGGPPGPTVGALTRGTGDADYAHSVTIRTHALPSPLPRLPCPVYTYACFLSLGNRRRHRRLCPRVPRERKFLHRRSQAPTDCCRCLCAHTCVFAHALTLTNCIHSLFTCVHPVSDCRVRFTNVHFEIVRSGVRIVTMGTFERRHCSGVCARTHLPTNLYPSHAGYVRVVDA
jgi:hypothetical protein